jgi:fructokinase
MQIRLNHKHSSFTARTPTAVGTGLVALDVLLRDERTTAYSALGGSAGNVLAILAHLGWSVTPVASLGRDAAADRIYHEFKKLGADTRFLACEDHQYTPVVYQLPSNGESTHRFSFSCPFCGIKRGFSSPEDDTLSDAVLQHAPIPSVFYFDRVTPWALELAEKYRERGAIVMFEPSVIGTDLDAFQRAIKSAHILKYADDRIDDLKDFHRDSVEVEVQTRGKRGLQFRTQSTASSWHELPAFAIPYLADTAGAGDWCSAGFLFALIGSVAENGGSGFMSTRRVKESLRFGQILAALNCMQVGARGLARQFDRNHIVSTAAAIRNAIAVSAISDHFAEISQREPVDHVSHVRNHTLSVSKVAAKVHASWLCCKSLVI